MTANSQQTDSNRVAPWDVLPAGPVLTRGPEEKARILAHLQTLLAQARAMNGAEHADA